MKKKILHLIYNLGVGGTEKMMQNTLPRLSDFDHFVCVINAADPAVDRYFIEKNIPVIRLKGAKIFGFRKLIKIERPDLIVTYLIYADLFGRIFGRLFGVKKIITSVRSTYNEPKYGFWLFLERITSFLVTKYVAVSQSVKNDYQNKLKIPAEKIEVIYNGVSVEKHDIQIDKNLKKKELGILEIGPVLGASGKFRPEKGQTYLIQALPQIIKKFPDAILVLVGGGEDKPKLESLAKMLNVEKNLMLLEERDDIPEVLKTLDVFLNPSLYEGLSNSILEAMASRIPIVASDIPANREVIEDKKSGLLVPVKNSGQIAKAVTEILENPDLGQKLAAAAFERVHNFSIEKTVEKLNNLFHQILNG